MEESSSSSLATMLKLTASNYSIWKPRMEDILYCKDLYEPFQLLGQKPEGKSDDAWSILNRKAIGQIRQWVDQSVFHHVAQETDAYKLCTKFSSMYEQKTTQNKASVIQRLLNLKYRDGRSVTEHLSDFQVKDSMFNEEARRKEQGVVAESKALISKYRGRTNNRKFHKRDKSKSKSRDGSRGRSKTRKDLECYHCDGIGHMKRECRLFKREQDRGNEKSDARHTTATTSGGNEDVRHVLDMRLNLIYTGLLDDEGYTNVFAEGKWKLSKNSLVLARGKKENTLYMTHAKVSNGYVNALAKDSIELWHKRLSHMSEKGLQILAKREALIGMKKGMPLKSCTHYLAGKQHRAQCIGCCVL
ncbi:unnamed protein product [Prunus armeniaca]